ncbi:VOC family protein [Neomegalonema sp.]|uniref:VOC family protein n=1 Tax=Neomegalonema sp. TaxID=2039713 RepID=UPI002611CFB9|nr:VOC family protein [Neomegalonema sp.]MDD2869794.1 VOC family protein [Neomegalonema sp.]
MHIDHLVIGAATLEQGRDWLEERLGVPASPGGRHELMGTHNLLWSLGPQTYLELLAVDPAAAAPSRPRWFGLDDPHLQARLKVSPRLLGWGLATEDVARDAALSPLGLGPVEPMSRGDRRWRLTIPEGVHTGHRALLPFLIQWEGPSPARSLPASGLSLSRLVLETPETAAIEAELKALGALGLVDLRETALGESKLMAELNTPEGAYSLVS